MPTYKQIGMIILRPMCVLFAGLFWTGVWASVDIEALTSQVWKLAEEGDRPTPDDRPEYLKFNKEGQVFIITTDGVQRLDFDIKDQSVLAFTYDDRSTWKIETLRSSEVIMHPTIQPSKKYVFQAVIDKKDKIAFQDFLDEHILRLESLSRFAEEARIEEPADADLTPRQKSFETTKTENKAVEVTEQKPEPAITETASKTPVTTPVPAEREKKSALVHLETVTSTKTLPSRKEVKEEPAPKIEAFEVKESDYIEIFVSGGGFKGGINPKLHDRVMIYNSGLVQKEYISIHGGEENYTKQVSREDLMKLAQFVVSQNFFNFRTSYDCRPDDLNCQLVKEGFPEPIPLKVVIAVGLFRHNVDVPIFAPGIEKNYVNYPPELVEIVNAIYDFARL